MYLASKTNTYLKFLKLSPPFKWSYCSCNCEHVWSISIGLFQLVYFNWSISLLLISQLSRPQDLLYFRTRTSQTVVARDDRPHNLHRLETFENLLHFHSNKHILLGRSFFERSMISVSLNISLSRGSFCIMCHFSVKACLLFGTDGSD